MIYLEQFRNVTLPEFNPFTSLGRPVQTQLATMADGTVLDRGGNDQALSAAGTFQYVGNFYNDEPYSTEALYYGLLTEKGKAGWLLRRRDVTGTYERIWARLVDVQHTHTVGFKGLAQQISLTFFAQDPVWNGQRWGDYELAGGRMVAASQTDSRGAPGMPIGTAYSVTATSGSSTTLDVYNGGNAPVTGIYITVTVAGSTAVSGIRIYTPASVSADNVDPAYDFKLTASLGGTGLPPRYYFDTAAKIVRDSDGSGQYSTFTHNANHNRSDWLRLEPGATTLTIATNSGTFPAGGVTVKVEFADAWQ